MKVALTANPNKPAALALALRAAELLEGKADVVYSTETAGALQAGGPSAPLESLAADVLVAFGGDGTFLSALQRSPLPLLPVNAGTVGFLAEIDGDQGTVFTGAIERLLAGRYYLEERMRIGSEMNGHSFPPATNEVVVHSAQVAKMRQFEIGIDGRPVGRLRADGVILSTPTGSTSYALSALGPVIDPAVEAIVVAALAPFRSTQRAVVVDPLKTVSVTLVDAEKEAVVVVDGQGETRVPGGGRLIAFRSPRKAAFVRFGFGFFRRLHGKNILPWVEETVETEGRNDADFPSSA